MSSINGFNNSANFYPANPRTEIKGYGAKKPVELMDPSSSFINDFANIQVKGKDTSRLSGRVKVVARPKRKDSLEKIDKRAASFKKLKALSKIEKEVAPIFIPKPKNILQNSAGYSLQKHLGEGIKLIEGADIPAFQKMIKNHGLGNGLTCVEFFKNNDYETTRKLLNFGKVIAAGSFGKFVHIDAHSGAKQSSPWKAGSRPEHIAEAESSDKDVEFFVTVKRMESILKQKHPLLKPNFPVPSLIMTHPDAQGITKRNIIVMTNLGKDMFELCQIAPYPYTIERYAQVARRQLEAIGFMHACKFIHRDIKPENLFSKGIADFGLSIKMEDLIRDKFPAAGSLPYISLEMILENSYNSKTDLWSFACALFVGYVGEQLFDIPSDIPYADVLRLNHMWLISERLSIPCKKLYELSSEKIRKDFFTVNRQTGEISFVNAYQHYNAQTGEFSLERHSDQYVIYKLLTDHHIKMVNVPGSNKPVFYLRNQRLSESDLNRYVLFILKNEAKMFSKFEDRISHVAEKRGDNPQQANLLINLIRNGLNPDPKSRIPAEDLLESHPYMTLALAKEEGKMKASRKLFSK